MNYETTTKIILDDGNVLEVLNNFANYDDDECGDGPHEKGYTLEEILNMKKLISDRESAHFLPVTPYEMSKLLSAEGLPKHRTNMNPKDIYWTSQGMGFSHPNSRFGGKMILAKLRLVPGINDVITTQLFGEDYEDAGERVTRVEVEPKVTLDYSTAVIIPSALMLELSEFCKKATSGQYEEHVQAWEEIGRGIYFPRHGAVNNGLGSVNLVNRFCEKDSTFETCHAFVCWRNMFSNKFTLYDTSMSPNANWGQGYNSCWLKRVR